jgi:hypothetical protein
MPGDGLERHVLGEVEDVAFEGAGVASARGGEGEVDLACGAALEAEDAWDVEVNDDGFGANGDGAKFARDGALLPDVGAMAGGACEALAVLGDMEMDAALAKLGAEVVVAAEAEGVIE